MGPEGGFGVRRRGDQGGPGPSWPRGRTVLGPWVWGPKIGRTLRQVPNGRFENRKKIFELFFEDEFLKKF